MSHVHTGNPLSDRHCTGSVTRVNRQFRIKGGEMIAQLIPHIFFSCPPFKVEAGSFFRDPELLRVIGIKIALNDKYYVYHLSEKCRDGRTNPTVRPQAHLSPSSKYLLKGD